MLKTDRSKLLSGNTALYVGCLHARANEFPEDWDRFRAIGKMAYDFRVNGFFCTGDLTDYPSARSWNSPKRQENLRVEKDRNAGIMAAREMMAPYHEQKRKHKSNRHSERIWEPCFGITAGNHDESEDEIVAQDPKLDGYIGSKFLYDEWRKMGWRVWTHRSQVLDLEYPEFHGTLFGHFYPSGAMGRATGIKQILNNTHESFIFSHTEEFGLDIQRTARGRFIQAVNIGTFQPHHRLKPGNWNGAIICSEMCNGEFQVHQFDYDWIMANYGEGSYAHRLRENGRDIEYERQDLIIA